MDDIIKSAEFRHKQAIALWMLNTSSKLGEIFCLNEIPEEKLLFA